MSSFFDPDELVQVELPTLANYAKLFAAACDLLIQDEKMCPDCLALKTCETLVGGAVCEFHRHVRRVAAFAE